MSLTRPAPATVVRGLLAIALLGGTLWCAGQVHTAWQRSELTEPMPGYLLTDRYGRYLANISGDVRGHYGYWALDTLPERVVAATLSLEDKRFHQHPGIDLVSVLRALVQNLDCGCVVSGASTIAMQTARLQHPAPRSLQNKAMEALTALLMTQRYGREAVLHQYLRLVPYGNGSHGIAHAARFYFDKPVDKLSWAEIALLSALPHAPDRLNPLRSNGREQAFERARRILASLYEDGLLDLTEYDLAVRQLDQLRVIHRASRPDTSLHAILELEAQLKRVGTPGGVIRTSLDLDAQRHLSNQAHEWLRQYQAGGVEQLSVLVVDRTTLAVRAHLGSVGYHSDAGAIDYSTTLRSPGSVLKPLVYALALEHGVIQPNTILWDDWRSAPDIDNADRRGLGPMLPRQALANSRNIPAVSLVRATGLHRVYQFLERAGLHHSQRRAEHYGVGITIGTLPTRLRDVVRAYGVLANDGEYRDLTWLLTSEAPSTETTRLLSPDSTRLITAFLSDPMARLPSFARMSALEYDYPIAIKTGTSQNVRDVWTLAYSHDFIIGVWAGRPDGGPIQGGLSGLRAAELVKALFEDLYALPGAPVAASFAVPTGYRQTSICMQTGHRAEANCPNLLQEWLPDNGTLSGLVPTLATANSGWISPSQQPIELTIIHPRTGSVLYRNPETPANLQSFPVTLEADPQPEQVVWYVNGLPEAVQSPGDPLYWPMSVGTYQFEVGLPYRPERSAPITVQVR